VLPSVTGGVKMQKSGDFKMLFCGGDICRPGRLFLGAAELLSWQV
jgi:hypothetical protein